MNFVYNDGGRAAAGYRGHTGDCVTRSIAIATGMSYQEVYDALNALAARERTGKRIRKRSNARTGVRMDTARRYLKSIGWRWVPTMAIGQGCKVHLADGELPMGRLVVQVTRHLTAVIDGVIHDNHDPQRESSEQILEREVDYVLAAGERLVGRYTAFGKSTIQVARPIGGRCVYGYFVKE